jgi:hypothetical protein
VFIVIGRARYHDGLGRSNRRNIAEWIGWRKYELWRRCR